MEGVLSMGPTLSSLQATTGVRMKSEKKNLIFFFGGGILGWEGF